MALNLLKLPIRFPIFAPTIDPNLTGEPAHHSTEVRFSRWNNANAERFNERRRTLQEIEDDIRRTRRFHSADKIVGTASSSASASAVQTFKSTGTPSAPSRPSIPGRKSKYSKPPPPPPPADDSHPALKFSNVGSSNPSVQLPPEDVKIGEDGISYVVDGAPFEFRYSYTEIPTAKPLKMREPPFVPFGPATMPRPWTGRAPMQPGNKKLRNSDSFVMPPAKWKGVMPVESPGPSPQEVRSREEVLGVPLTKEEITELVGRTMKSSRQLNIGRDGLTHNMLENIHAHWKRQRVCKIKCKGVCTVDMNNVCQQLEERTGGKIIYRKGGAVYIFRGRNYNYKTRPRFPLMLWKPVPPVYPRLIKRVPEGLTLKEATEMREKGRHLIPICKLAKNGVYCRLVPNVREAFEACELVRINCQGLNESDYRRIGAKLRDLVPCVLLSFENEHILMWRGKNWKSSLSSLEDDCLKANEIHDNGESSITLTSDAEEEISSLSSQKNAIEQLSIESHEISISCGSSDANVYQVKLHYPIDHGNPSVSMVTDAASLSMRTCEDESTDDDTDTFDEPPLPSSRTHPSEAMLGTSDDSIIGLVDPHTDNLPDSSAAPCTEGVLLLLQQAVVEGSALVLDDESLDDESIYQATKALAKSAPPGPVFSLPRKVLVEKINKQEDSTLERQEIPDDKIKGKTEKTRKSSKIRSKEASDERQNVARQGTIGVDELARLLT